MSNQQIPHEWLGAGRYHPNPLHNTLLLLLERHGRMTRDKVMELMAVQLSRAWDDIAGDGMLLEYEGLYYFDNSLPVRGVFNNSTALKVENPSFARGDGMAIPAFIIAGGGRVSRRDIMRAFRKIKKRELDKIMGNLIADNAVVKEVIKPAGGRPATYYKIVIDS